MSKVISVPVHLDGFFLNHDQLVKESFADFSRLPFKGSEKDYNPDTPNTSESILSTPFQDNNLTLKKGIHLHWSLPDALTRGGAEGTLDDYPAVPNRWLIKRASTQLGERSWVVESDYLHIGLDNPYGSISFPIDSSNPFGQPYGYLGRQLDATNWAEDATTDRLEKLTAIGYGEPTFAAFYPNCHSVFGCFDPEVNAESKLQGLSYQIIGWYSDAAKDPFLDFVTNEFSSANVAEIETEIQTQNPAATTSELKDLVNDELTDQIKDEFSWKVAIDKDDLPEGMVCYADLKFTSGRDINNAKKSKPATVSIGNTGTEALSAYLARQLNPGNPIQLEEQLENLFLESKLQDADLDIGPRFKQARHENGFNANNSGSLWEIKPLGEDDTTAPVKINLPSAITDSLSELNVLQQQANRVGEQIADLKQGLFADWHKYMLCAYPPDDLREDYPDIDFVKWYIENTRTPEIEAAETDLLDKRSALRPLELALKQQIDEFNASTIAKEFLLQPLNDEAVNISDDVTLTNPTWVENVPFSAHCLEFNGTEAHFSITSLDTVKALSLWVYVPTQSAGDATLLATDNDGALIAKNGITDFWDKITINGVAQPTNQPLQWSRLPKDQWFHLYVEFSDALATNETVYLFSASSTSFLQGKLAAVRLFSDALDTNEIYYDQNMLGHQKYELNEVSGPRFWEPTEPVLLLEGESVEPTLRHGEDGRMNADDTLSCQNEAVGHYPLQVGDLSNLLSRITESRPASGIEQIGYATWESQPWYPFLLEWEVEVFPLAEGGNLHVDNRRFDPEFITSNYTLEENNPELTVEDGKSVIKSAAVYSGRSILTPYAKKQLTQTIAIQLNNLTQEDCYQVIGDIPDTYKETYNDELSNWYGYKPADIEDWYATDAECDDAVAVYRTWYESKPVYKNDIVTFNKLTDAEKLKDFNFALIQSHQAACNAHFISQALSGFNDALLMYDQTLQLAVADPLGFESYRTFTERVSQIVDGVINEASMPLSDFLPIRSGVMRLLKLQLIDTFGQVKRIEISSEGKRLAKATTLALPETQVTNTKPADVWLPPRLAQPARINFRWLSASSGLQELNITPESTPICGWVLANHLDKSLAVYDSHGNGIGIIDQEAKWRAIPGTDGVIDLADIANEHLRKVVERLALIADEADTDDTKEHFLQDFISVTDRALENIDPESFIHHQEMALLMGRPIAIVRASINLELQSNPAVHYGWTEFYQDLTRKKRETNGFEQVTIPVRIGERGQLNDGVIGYWKEDDMQQLDTTFQTTIASGVVDNDAIQSYTEAPLHLTQSLSSAPETLTLLIDPRGEVHATTGILPAKSINIPKDQYTDALKKINITFLTAPIITGDDQIALPLSKEPGYEWSWLAKDRFRWVETANTGILRKDTVLSAFENGADIWTELLDKGWITEVDDNRASIVPSNQRTSADLDAPINAQTDKIQALLDAGHILPVTPQAVFTPHQTIKEGWLKLSNS